MKTLPWDYNIHSHTFRCGHAEGSDEEYVEAAIEAGFRYMGFSDHVFLPGIIHKTMRGEISLLGDYISSVNALKEKYKDKIKIHLGFEAEYMPEFLTYYKDLLENKGIEYLILGQHCYFAYGKTHWYTAHRTLEEAIKLYTDDLIAGMRSGLFSYVAHPDFFMIYNKSWGEVHVEAAYRIAREAKALGIPLEINASQGRRYGKGGFDPMRDMTYPYPPFWKIVSEIGCDVVIGIDAHSPNHYRNADYDFLIRFVEEQNLNLITHCPLD